MSMRLGDIEISSVSGGKLWIDGGNMFGVVPKALWSRACESDAQNRILLETNCLLIRTAGKTILVDTGYGPKLDEKTRRNYASEEGNPLYRNLAEAGIAPDQIDVVILTHLHFDHAGGGTILEGDTIRPAFPNARYFVQKAEWEDATGDVPELVGSYFKEDFVPLEEAGLVEFVDGDEQIMPGIRVKVTGGHTRGHQIIYVGTGDEQAVYTADLCPYPAHLRTFWSMAYDTHPLQQRKMKPIVLGEAADRGWPILFDHDPNVKAAKIARDVKKEFVVREQIQL